MRQRPAIDLIWSILFSAIALGSYLTSLRFIVAAACSGLWLSAAWQAYVAGVFIGIAIVATIVALRAMGVNI
jgi:hypothetical protein